MELIFVTARQEQFEMLFFRHVLGEKNVIEVKHFHEIQIFVAYDHEFSDSRRVTFCIVLAISKQISRFL